MMFFFILDTLYFKVYLVSSYLSYYPHSCLQALHIILAFLLEVNALSHSWLILKLLPEKVAGIAFVELGSRICMTSCIHLSKYVTS